MPLHCLKWNPPSIGGLAVLVCSCVGVLGAAWSGPPLCPQPLSHTLVVVISEDSSSRCVEALNCSKSYFQQNFPSTDRIVELLGFGDSVFSFLTFSFCS